jgi:Zn finger protein HypA/HybF involved in hydrogenase expression
MAKELEGSGRQGYARCTDCGETMAALIGESGDVVTVDGECQECGSEEFDVVDADELDGDERHEEWA